MSRLYPPIVLLGLVVAVLLPGCRGEPTSPEVEVRVLINSAAAAAEQKRVGMLGGLISENYADDRGRDKRTIEHLLRLHFLRNEALHLYTRVVSIALPQPDRAEAVVLVAMAGVPIASDQELSALRADLHRFEFSLAREPKSWRVQRAAWRRAAPGEFLNP